MKVLTFHIPRKLQSWQKQKHGRKKNWLKKTNKRGQKKRKQKQTNLVEKNNNKNKQTWWKKTKQKQTNVVGKKTWSKKKKPGRYRLQLQSFVRPRTKTSPPEIISFAMIIMIMMTK